MPASDKLATLVQWFEDNEVEWSKDLIEVKDTNGSLGVFAKKDIEEGLPVVKIPKVNILSSKTTGIANVIEDEQLEGGCSLALAVMYECAQGEDSPWYGYIQALPVMEDLPVFWSEEEQAVLKGTEMEDALENDMKDLREDYEEILKPLFEKYRYIFPEEQQEKFYSYETFCKISTLVSSRAFEVDAYHENAMVPFADIFNHQSGAEHVHFETDFDVCDACGALEYCEHRFFEDDDDFEGPDDEEGGWSDVEEEDIEESTEEEEADEEEGDENEGELDGEESDQELQDLEALESKGVNIYEDEEDEQPPKDTCDLVMDRSAKKGEELFNTYGDHANIVLLSKYGFCQEENENDFVTVDEDMVVDACVDQLAKILKEKGIEASQEDVINYVRMRWEYFIMNESVFLPDEHGDMEDDEGHGDHEGDGCGCGHSHGDDNEPGQDHDGPGHEGHGHDHDHDHDHDHEREHEHEHDPEGGCCDHEHGEEEDEEDEEDEYRPRPYRIEYSGIFEEAVKYLLHIVFVDEQMFMKFVDNPEMALGYFAELADSEAKVKPKSKKGKKKPVDIFVNVKRNVNHVLHQLVLARQKAYDEAGIAGDQQALKTETNQRKRFALICRISEKQILDRALQLYP